MQIFDRQALSCHAARAMKNWKQHDFLWQHTASQLQDRILDIRRTFPQAAEVGMVPMVLDNTMITAEKVRHVTYIHPYGTHDTGMEFWPLEKNSCDMIVSHNQMHWINDVPGVLLQMRQSLKPDGVFLASFFGGDTLQELRQSIAAVELEIYGGMSPRVSPFATLQDAAALIQRAGFSLPVVDHDYTTVTYADVTALIRDLRGMGQTHAVMKRDKRILRRDFWPRVDAYYRTHFANEKGRLNATVETFYLLGWAPAASQPVALARGTATHSLSDILRIHEEKIQ